MMDWAFFQELLSIDSTSGKERKVAQWLLEHLEAPSKQSFEVGDGTLNLLLQWGTPKVVFCTHMDTVPPFIPPTFPEGIRSEGLVHPRTRVGGGARRLAVREADEADSGRGRSERSERSSFGAYPLRINGRGSCDAKGQLFAMYTACKELEAEGCTDFGLLLLAGEETGSWGAKAFDKTGWGAPFLIVGEPTENKMVSASKGTLSYDLLFRGVPFHSGYPQYGVSAVDLFNQFYNQLKATDFGVDPLLGETTWNVGLLHSDNPQNILSPELRCRLYFRTTFVSHEAVQRWMTEAPGRVGVPSASLRDPVRVNRRQAEWNGACSDSRGAKEETEGNAPGTPTLPEALTVTPRGGDTPARYVTLEGFEAAPVAFGSDAPHLNHFGHKSICGPGTIRVAHRDDEHILVRDLETAVGLYKAMCRRMQTYQYQ